MRASVRTGLLIGIAAATLVAARAGAAQRESPEELPPPESVEDIQPPLEEQVKEAKGETAYDDPSILGSVRDELRRLPPFGEGASLRLTLRSYYMYGKLKTNNRREAWVYGGSVLYQTPQLGDRLALGAEFFVSQPIHAPSNRDGTLLLRPRQRQYAVFGQTYAKLELTDDHVATLYRQTYDLPYLNKEYNRMTPTTFEGYTVQGGFGGDDADELLYIAGYVSKIKTRNSDRFIPMGARAAPAAQPKRGTWMAGATYQPTDRISIGAIDYYTRDVLNLFYAQAAGTWSLRDGLPVRALLQFTDQRSVNDDLITGSSFDTRSLVGQVAASYGGGTFRVAFSTTSREALIRTSWGLPPTPLLSLLGVGYQRADEEAWLVGGSFSFRLLGLDGLSVSTHYVWGTGARDETSGRSLRDQGEVNVTVDYRPKKGPLRGLWVRVRGAWLKEEGSGDSQNELRVILNYDLPVL